MYSLVSGSRTSPRRKPTVETMLQRLRYARVTILLLVLLCYPRIFTGRNKSNLRKPQIIADKIRVEKTKEEIIKRQRAKIPLKRPSHGKLKLANSCWQSQVGVCERHKNRRQTRFYLTPTVCKCVCRLFLCRSHTPTWVCQHDFANLSLLCEARLRKTEMENE